MREKVQSKWSKKISVDLTKNTKNRQTRVRGRSAHSRPGLAPSQPRLGHSRPRSDRLGNLVRPGSAASVRPFPSSASVMPISQVSFRGSSGPFLLPTWFDRPIFIFTQKNTYKYDKKSKSYKNTKNMKMAQNLENRFKNYVKHDVTSIL